MIQLITKKKKTFQFNLIKTIINKTIIMEINMEGEEWGAKILKKKLNYSKN